MLIPIELDDEGIARLQRAWMIDSLARIRAGIAEMLDEAQITDTTRRNELTDKAMAKAGPLLLRCAVDEAEAFRRGDTPPVPDGPETASFP